MSRVHRRDPRGDYSLEMVTPDRWAYGGQFAFLATPPRFLLSMPVTMHEAQLLAEQGNRGLMSFSSTYSGPPDQLMASGIEVTEAEAHRIVAGGEHPREVLFGAFPACGYRLRAVPEQF